VGGDTCVNAHAKLMVVDDALARVGSANLSDRSLELDTQCDAVAGLLLLIALATWLHDV